MISWRSIVKKKSHPFFSPLVLYVFQRQILILNVHNQTEIGVAHHLALTREKLNTPINLLSLA